MILDLLDFEDIKNVGLVNKLLRAASIGALFRTINFEIFARVYLHRDVELWTERLLHLSCLSQVQRIIVSGSMPLEEEDKITENYHPMPKPYWWTPWLHVIRPDHRSTQSTIDEDNAWHPLAALIRKLPSLTRLDFNCINQLPPCLLEAASAQGCHLHIGYFGLRSFRTPESGQHEFSIITSPQLRSMKIEIPHQGTYIDAVFRVISTLAHNLRDIEVFNPPPPPATPWGPPPVDNVPWTGFPQDTATSKRAKLRRLDTCSGSPTMQTWNSVVDLGALEQLNTSLLEPSHNVNNGLLWLSTNKPFFCLKDLSFSVRNHNSELAQDCRELVCDFIRSLPALRSLSLDLEPVSPTIMTTILRCHGHTLRTLIIPNRRQHSSEFISFDANLIEQISKSCPLLEEMSIWIVRSKGDAKEAAIYRALGSIARLQKIDLVLDCAVFDMLDERGAIRTDPTFNAFDEAVSIPEREPDIRLRPVLEIYRRSPLNGHIRDMLLNIALDHDLACAIFESISDGRSHQGDKALALQQLQLVPYGGGYLGTRRYVSSEDDGLDDVCRHLGRSWMVKRDIRDGLNGRLIAECGPVNRYIWGPRYNSRRRNDPDSMPAYVEPVFRKLWPERKGKRWQDDWHSFPLAKV